MLGLGERKRIGTLDMSDLWSTSGRGGGVGCRHGRRAPAAASGPPRPHARRAGLGRRPRDPVDANVMTSTPCGGHRRTRSPSSDGEPTPRWPTRCSTPTVPTLRPKLIWFNLALTLAVMVLLVIDMFPLPYVFMVGAAIALIVNFPKLGARPTRSSPTRPASSASSRWCSPPACWSACSTAPAWSLRWRLDHDACPPALGPFLAVITGILSIPFTFFMSNDAFYFGILPVLAESAANYGIAPVEMARASITGQPVHLQSPLVPAILLLVSLASVNLGDHHKKVLWRACVVSLVMLAVGVLVGAIPFG